MALPKAIRGLTPDRLRDSPRLRALALTAGMIPPRTMHTPAEADLLARLAAGRHTAVEIGVYEGSSAIALAQALPSQAELHLIDPFVETTLRPGWKASGRATRRAVERSLSGTPAAALQWHPVTSEEAARGWSRPVDLVFIDGDHSQEGCRLDWDLWNPHVEPGGVVVFHDARAGRPGGWGLPGPTAIVDRLFREEAVEGWAILEEVDTAVAVTRSVVPKTA